jgi:hypothetical protein
MGKRSQWAVSLMDTAEAVKYAMCLCCTRFRVCTNSGGIRAVAGHENTRDKHGSKPWAAGTTCGEAASLEVEAQRAYVISGKELIGSAGAAGRPS